MNDSLSIRLASFALATLVTVSILSGIDSLAQLRQAGGVPLSQAAPAAVVAGAPAQPRS